MSAQPSAKVTKQITYRGAAKQWSNRHHFTNAMPTTDTRKAQFCDNIEAAEKLCQSAQVTIVKIDLYDAGSDLPVYTRSYGEVGTMTLTDGSLSPGDVAALVRYSTTQRTSKNHPIYLFNYYHAAYYYKDHDVDVIAPTQKTKLQDYADTWLGGISDGVLNHIRCGPNGAVAQSRLVENFLTHRDFRK
jgi:hypothetical protein